jgi:hypothetical protein
MENCKSFFSGGGKGMWKFIVFKHNEHQIEEAKKLSIEMGFEVFNIVASERFEHREEKVVFFKNKNDLMKVEKPTNNYKMDELKGDEYSSINCNTLKRNEIFVDDKGRVMPCCWTMGRIAEHGNLGNDKNTQFVWNRYDNIMDELNALKNGIINVLNHKFWSELEMLWEINYPNVCVSKCKKRMDDVSHYFVNGKPAGWKKI